MSTVSAPLSSPAFFTSAIYALQDSSNQLGLSTARLSSGNRIINAGDDVAALSISSQLQSQLSGLKQAASNVAQGSSLLQVASGGLQQIRGLLDNLNSLAIQASSSSLTNADRGYLQQQFAQNLTTIDSIVSNTTFNKINLIDGTLSGEGQLQSTTSNATKASGTITFAANPSAGQTVIVNGVTLTANTDFTVGGSAAATVASLLTALQNSTNTALSQASYAASGTNGISITARTGGTLGKQFTINQASSTAAFSTAGDTTSVANLFTLSGGLDDGLNRNSTKATGTIGDTLVNTQSQTPASVTLTVTGAIADGETLNIDDGNGGLQTFTFKTSASASNEIQIGASTEATLQNAVKTITQFSTTNDFGLRQLNYSISGSTLTISNKTVGNPTDLTGANLDITETLANGSLSAATFSNGTSTGVDTSGVTNSDFVGQIQGFTATYVGADSLTASVTVGGSTYTSAITDTTPAGNTTARFTSSSGGYFDVQLAAGQGTTVTNQSTANDFASRLNSAFQSLDFYQQRSVSNFSPTGTLVGSTAKLQLDDFGTPKISSVQVTYPGVGTDATIALTVNGSTFKASTGLGGSIGAYESVKFINQDDANESITFTNGAVAQDLSTTNAAATFQSSLRTAFGVDTAGTAARFQVGVGPTDTLDIAINSASSDALFNGVLPGVATTGDAASAQTAITTAINSVQTIISNVGALQSSLGSQSSNLAQSITGIAAANSQLADTDIVAESTNFAQQTVKVNAGVAVLAQALALQSNLLGLLHTKG